MNGNQEKYGYKELHSTENYLISTLLFFDHAVSFDPKDNGLSSP
tara:strand:+ start:586 stop:717 length:132 start_codon:yes stop_codon:yes gene_type:complete